MKRPVMIALDVKDKTEMMNIVDQFPKDDKLVVKVGMQLFYGEGPKVIEELIARNCEIFLDLKLHDIPNTVKEAMTQVGRLGVSYVTIHAIGGSEMIKAAKEGLIAGSKEVNLPTPKLLAVTVLTSISDDQLANEQNCKLKMVDQVVSLAKLAKRSGADGVITSPLEVSELKAQVGDDFMYVTPGIRLQTSPSDDQTRTATPRQARQYGSSALVVGRPILNAPDRAAAYRQIMEEFNNED